MPGKKTILASLGIAGLEAAVVRIRYRADRSYVDNADGALRAEPAAPDVPMAEIVGMPGWYMAVEDRAEWPDGMYQCAAYESPGGRLRAFGHMQIKDDLEVTPVTVQAAANGVADRATSLPTLAEIAEGLR